MHDTLTLILDISFIGSPSIEYKHEGVNYSLSNNRNINIHCFTLNSVWQKHISLFHIAISLFSMTFLLSYMTISLYYTSRHPSNSTFFIHMYRMVPKLENRICNLPNSHTAVHLNNHYLPYTPREMRLYQLHLYQT